MPKIIDLVGKKFGRLTVVERSPKRPRAWWVCRCDCGKTATIAAMGLKQGTKSCGCLQKEWIVGYSTIHGHAPTESKKASGEYNSWRGMHNRCNNPHHRQYHNYGGRGIKACERWDNFEHFLADMGPKKRGDEIERLDNSLGYSPDNCIWMSKIENNRNRRDNLIIEFNGEKLCLSEWAEKTGIGWHTLYHRIKSGWPIEKALTKSVT